MDWEKTGADWVTVPLFFIGAFAGANNIYRMVQKFLSRRMMAELSDRHGQAEYYGNRDIRQY